MDAFFVVLGLLVLAFPIMAIVALVKSVGLGEQGLYLSINNPSFLEPSNDAIDVLGLSNIDH